MYIVNDMYNNKKTYTSKFTVCKEYTNEWHQPVRWIQFATTLLLFVAGTVPRLALSAEYFAEPYLEVQEIYDDNIRLTTQKHDSTYGTIIKPGINLGIRSQNTEVNLGVNLITEKYMRKNLDTDDQLLRFDALHRTERSKYAIEYEFSRDSSLRTEIEDTGRVSANTRRRKRSYVHPTWGYDITNETNIEFGMEYTDIQYPRKGNSGLRDSTVYGANAVFTKMWTPTLDYFVELYANEYNSVTGLNINLKYYGVNFGGTKTLSDTFSYTLSAGLQRTNSEAQVLTGGIVRSVGSSSNGFAFSAKVDKKFETTTVSALLQRNLQPTSRGNLNERDEFRVNVKQRLTEILEATLQTRVIQQSATTQTGSNDRVFYSVEPGITWKVTRDLDISGAYRYRNQKFDNASSSATSNLFMILFHYNVPRISVAR